MVLEEYSPGGAGEALWPPSTQSARSAQTHAAFLLPLLEQGARLLDVGCGPGSITVGLASVTGNVLGVDRSPGQLARAVTAAGGAPGVAFLAGDAMSLPLPDSATDVVFAHDLLEHLREPDAAIAEFRRVLRPGGLLALSTSDWSRARLRPATANVAAALRGYYLLCRGAGGDPFAGRSVVDRVRRAGFGDVRTKTRYRPDVGYEPLAKFVESSLVAALSSAEGDRDQLASAARSAWVWARAGRGDFSQCWVEVLATR